MIDVPSGCPSTDVDLWADDVLADPYTAYAELRVLGPVAWMTTYGASTIASEPVWRASRGTP